MVQFYSAQFVGVEGYGRTAVAQPGRDGVDVQAGLQPMARAAVAEAVGGRVLDASSGGGRLIPSAIQRAALLGDSGLPLRPVNTLSARLR